VKTSADLAKLVVFMVVTALLTLTLAATIGNLSLGEKTRYKAVFNDVTGLLPGNEVRIAGVRVGSVKKLDLYEKKLAEVEFDLDDGRTIPKSAVVQLRYRNLVGERYLAIVEGPGSAEPLEEGGRIPLQQTRDALDLTILFNGFRPLFQALDPASVNKVAFELVQTLQGEGGTVESLMQKTASLTNALADRDAVIGRVITNLGTVLATVDDNSTGLNELVSQLQRLAKGLAQDRQAIGASLDGIADLSSATASLLVDTRGPLRADIAELGQLAKTLDDNEATVEGVIQRLPTKLDRIIGTATYGSWFNFYLCGFDGRIVLPTGETMTPQFVNTAERCQEGPVDES
jgi:phospholipid/cholesterol/gamma-HCH transport system substrate-binding protein